MYAFYCYCVQLYLSSVGRHSFLLMATFGWAADIRLFFVLFKFQQKIQIVFFLLEIVIVQYLFIF